MQTADAVEIAFFVLPCGAALRKEKSLFRGEEQEKGFREREVSSLLRFRVVAKKMLPSLLLLLSLWFLHDRNLPHLSFLKMQGL